MMSSVKVGGGTISFYALGVDVHVLIRVRFMHFTRRLSVCQVASIGAALALVLDSPPSQAAAHRVSLSDAGEWLEVARDGQGLPELSIFSPAWGAWRAGAKRDTLAALAYALESAADAAACARIRAEIVPRP